MFRSLFCCRGLISEITNKVILKLCHQRHKLKLNNNQAKGLKCGDESENNNKRFKNKVFTLLINDIGLRIREHNFTVKQKKNKGYKKKYVMI